MSMWDELSEKERDAAIREGYEAASGGDTPICPYKRGSASKQAWETGVLMFADEAEGARVSAEESRFDAFMEKTERERWEWLIKWSDLPPEAYEDMG